MTTHRGMPEANKAVRTFYEKQYQGPRYAPARSWAEHSHGRSVQEFLDNCGRSHPRCLEIGCGRGALQNLVDDYTGIDLSRSAGGYLQKPFAMASATDLPFADSSFDVVWTVNVLEHVPDPERALNELRRVVRDKGRIYLAAAWQCRPWAADGYAVRPYRDFTLKGKLIKLSIPLRESVAFRAAFVMPRRAVRFTRWRLAKEPTEFRYDPLLPNYEDYWVSDSDATNSMDPYDAILWFISRGDTCLNYPTHLKQIMVRTGKLLFEVNKSQGGPVGCLVPQAGVD